jgi:hypothetical protein
MVFARACGRRGPGRAERSHSAGRGGLAVSLSDSAARAGGRCRSYFDPSLGLTIDNGNHLVLASNPAVKAFRERIGAMNRWLGPSMPISPSPIWARVSAGSCASTMAPSLVGRRAEPPHSGHRHRRLPALGKLLLGKGEQTIGDLIATKGPVWDRMLAPVLLAVLNTDPPVPARCWRPMC